MTPSDFKRWLYRGSRLNWIARILNRAWAAVASSGVASNYLVTLEATGRKSGRTISLPVVMAVVDGQRYLVSMLGDNVHWVHNVRAAAGRAVLRSAGREEAAAHSDALRSAASDGFRLGIERDGIFGVPSFVYAGKLYWGQDRIHFLRDAVARKSTRP